MVCKQMQGMQALPNPPASYVHDVSKNSLMIMLKTQNSRTAINTMATATRLLLYSFTAY